MQAHVQAIAVFLAGALLVFRGEANPGGLAARLNPPKDLLIPRCVDPSVQPPSFAPATRRTGHSCPVALEARGPALHSI
jgi:hypothetical protein